ncbi:MAG: iron ABC transporter permease [Candidatus Eremiobacteraeota bacterium]|nr:iron ABC transporter permease [Candidatus Eremiobacteraeota bacterium]
MSSRLGSSAGGSTLTALRFAAAIVGVVLAILIGAMVGATHLPFHEVIGALQHPTSSTDATTILWTLRLPRATLAAIVGAALSVSGAIMQAMLRNPLVDPYLTGVSAGAAAAIAIAVAAGIAAPFVPALGFCAGLAAAIVVAMLARRGSGIDANRLILAGVSLSALFSAIVALVLTRLQQGSYAETIISWLAGSLAGRTWHDLQWTVPYLIAGVVAAVVAIPALNVLRLGDTRAAALGVNVERAQWVVVGSAALLTASAVALSGIVGFVGLIVPHIARRIGGSDLRIAVPLSALFGAAFMTLADAASRALFAPIEIPLSVLLACIGVPAFLYLYFRDSVPVRA